MYYCSPIVSYNHCIVQLIKKWAIFKLQDDDETLGGTFRLKVIIFLPRAVGRGASLFPRNCTRRRRSRKLKPQITERGREGERGREDSVLLKTRACLPHKMNGNAEENREENEFRGGGCGAMPEGEENGGGPMTQNFVAVACPQSAHYIIHFGNKAYATIRDGLDHQPHPLSDLIQLSFKQ